jgi:prophage tail gpP-like protein
MKPVIITVGGSALEVWTEMNLKRSKDELTGTLTVTIFGGDLPSAPIIRQAQAGAEIQCYIAGQLAFTGTVDRRTGSGLHGKEARKQAKGADIKTYEGKKPSATGTSPGGHGHEISIGPNEYTIHLTARGETKRLIDSAHQHPTTNMLKPTTKEVVEKLVEPWKTKVEWKAEVIKLDKMRFRDGARVVDELHRVAMENCYFMYETRDGKLRVTDGVGSAGGESGDPLILGQNILTFSAEQSEDKAKSKVKVKGQRSPKDKWGEEAVLKTFKIVENKSVKDFVPETVQHYGDADDKTLERRARFEANKHNSESKKITIEVFHVQTPSGQPWDVGNMHYVEVPPEGIFDMFECVELTYHVSHEKELKTTLVLSPPPSGGTGGAGGGFGLSALNLSMGEARRSQAGINIVSGLFPAAWSPPMLGELPLLTLVEEAAKLAQNPVQEEIKRSPPLTLPDPFEEL